MNALTSIAVLFVALQHAAFLVLEMFLWDKPLGRRVFGHSAQQAMSTRVLAANQGLYNGFLSAGIVWSWLLGPQGRPSLGFCLVCIVIAGCYGASSVSPKIFFVQAVPAGFALGLMYWTD